ncbi:hypothetical protein Y032_0002g892 [Ancylostoma ceylanicum]|uniref:Uncharacterized protein n=1 Tax=Ancylostoma ceylanicum TaxID=53326 RepID=A0A016W3R1_9BILA|nr:hypothetical protein Y032_0002g892 [Ancylostoma ceylanicum]
MKRIATLLLTLSDHDTLSLLVRCFTSVLQPPLSVYGTLAVVLYFKLDRDARTKQLSQHMSVLQVGHHY